MLTMLRSLPLSRLVATLAAVVVCACAARQPLGENVPPPRFVVGDRWEYRITDGLRRGATTRLDVQVVAMNAGVATMHLVFVDSYGRSEQTEEIDADGGLRVGALRNDQVRRFSPSLKLLDFPIGQRSSWRQVVNTFRRDTQLDDNILIYGEVQGRAPVTVPAGSYDAVAIYRIVQLDDEEFWRRLGFAVIQGYGLTETTSLVSLNHPFKLGRGSIGKALPGREIKLDAKRGGP